MDAMCDITSVNNYRVVDDVLIICTQSCRKQICAVSRCRKHSCLRVISRTDVEINRWEYQRLSVLNSVISQELASK